MYTRTVTIESEKCAAAGFPMFALMSHFLLQTAVNRENADLRVYTQFRVKNLHFHTQDERKFLLFPQEANRLTDTSVMVCLMIGATYPYIVKFSVTKKDSS